MTEAEWLAANDPKPMLNFLKGKVSERKLRLFVVDCCERVAHLMTDERSRRAFTLADQLVDASIDPDEHRLVYLSAGEARSELVRTRQQSTAGIPDMFTVAAIIAQNALGAERQFDFNAVPAIISATGIISFNPDSGIGDRAAVNRNGARVLREIVGNPFRPMTLDLTWLTSNVVDLARSIYDGTAFDRMPILADALMDAGCDNEAIFSHCQSGGPHVRGCWVVDLLLGKE